MADRLGDHFDDWMKGGKGPTFAPPEGQPLGPLLPWQLAMGEQTCPALGADGAAFIWCKAAGGVYQWCHGASVTELAPLTGLNSSSVVAYVESERSPHNAKPLQAMVKAGATESGLKAENRTAPCSIAAQQLRSFPVF